MKFKTSSLGDLREIKDAATGSPYVRVGAKVKAKNRCFHCLEFVLPRLVLSTVIGAPRARVELGLRPNRWVNWV